MLGRPSYLLPLLLALSLAAQVSPQNAELPERIQCDIGQTQKERPEKWQFMLRKEFANGKKTVEWHSEHDSAKAAMKECGKVIQAQKKIWKSVKK